MSKIPKVLDLEEGGYYQVKTPKYEDPDRKILQNRDVDESGLPMPFKMDEYIAWCKKRKENDNE